ncbi:MAG TPA: SOS response-associated peptidase [Gammaproteobacteria bacterium]|nr:SOS response-associated peptidase [Gammaproteobacteria bacterium]
MCGRFALFASPELTAEYFALAQPPALAPHYNVTPGQDVAAVRVDRDGRRALRALRWGLVPFWAKDATIGRRLINARLDSLRDKPAFREAFARRRCLIPASGFYEWGVDDAGKKQPFFIRPRGEPLLAMAGLWERWRPQGGEPLETCVIVTTDANALLAPIHDRMPVLLSRAAQDVWLDPSSDVAAIVELAAQGPELETWAVGTAVNDPRNDDERVIAPKSALF